MALVGSATVLPLFMATLTDRKWLIGIGSSIDIVGWLLPQAVGAYFIASKKFRLPWFWKMGIIRIFSIGSIAALTFLFVAHNKLLLLILFLLMESVHSFSRDSLESHFST